MPVKKKEITRTNDVVIILDQYQREHDVVAHQRTKYAIKALKRFFTGKKVSEIDIPMNRQYIAHRMSEGVAMSTVAREMTCLRAACNHAHRWKRIDTVPPFEIPTDLPKREIWLFKSELRHLINLAEDVNLEHFIRLCYGTGSRKTAIEELEWNQVNFARKTINLAKPNERKTNKRRPTVPMGELHEILVSLYDNRNSQWVLGTNKNRAYDFEKLCKKAGLLYVEEKDGRPAGKITPHVLRHTRATHLLEDGASIYAVAKLLGDTPTTVQRTYGHICMSSLEDELAKSSY